MAYAEVPLGLIFEFYSHSYELTYSQGAYKVVNKPGSGQVYWTTSQGFSDPAQWLI
jgi:hypothetical protein